MVPWVGLTGAAVYTVLHWEMYGRALQEWVQLLRAIWGGS